VKRIEDIWRDKTDEEVLNAAASLHDFTDEGRAVVLTEAHRRGLNIAPLVETVSALQQRGAADENSITHCGYCGTHVLFGGIRDGTLRFCNAVCRSNGVLLAVSNRVPEAVVNEELWKAHQGPCPRCGGVGPIDVHTSHRVWSAFVATSWSNRPHIVCQRCGSDARMKDALFSLACGWWGIPWGPIMTIVQITRNIRGDDADPSKPSAQLERLVRLRLAAKLVGSMTPPNTALHPSAASGR